jgi:hypothetical protein
VCGRGRARAALLGSGFIAGLPLVAASVALATRWHTGGGAAAAYLRAYRSGLWLRAVMTLLFMAAVLPLGPAWAMLLALAASGCVALTARLQPRGAAAPSWDGAADGRPPASAP